MASADLNIAVLKGRLRERRETMLATIRARLHQSDDPALLSLENHIAEEDDRLIADILNESDIVLLNGELEELGEIDAALSRVSAGTFGQCTVCGIDIPAQRLVVLPTASRCVVCEARVEHEQARRHSTYSF
ncbi:MAG TPA: TraR/DksA C4-type zinc finger protein [Burkholderiaceae bacterium]